MYDPTLPTTAVALTIAGSDSCAGAGIQADLKTFAAHKVYGASVITAVTAQNTCGVRAVHYVPGEIVEAQLFAVLDDLPVKAIKIGMLGSAAIVRCVSEILAQYPAIPVVIDPVMVAKSGAVLMAPDTLAAFCSHLLPKATLLTPNLPEAAALCGYSDVPQTLEHMSSLLTHLMALGCHSVLLKGGHLTAPQPALDLLSHAGHVTEFSAPRVDSANTHGTGCTLSSAIAAGLALELPLPVAVAQAKQYINRAIAQADQLNLGRGHGPLQHFPS